MYRVISNIIIEQQPSGIYPNRKKLIQLNYLTDYEWVSTWEDLTDKGSLVLPKNLIYKDANNAFNVLNGTIVNIGGFIKEPLFLRGDKIKLQCGYRYTPTHLTKEIDEMPLIFEGYIRNVHSKIPIKIDIEDNMFILKQTPMPTKTFTSNDSLESVLKLIISTVNKLHNLNFTFYDLAKTNVGNLLVGNETAGQLLERIGRLYGLKAYFRGNELRCGVFNYVSAEANTLNFILNGKLANVKAEGQELEYRRKDDIFLSAIAHNTVTENTGEYCKDGKTAKTKRRRLEVLVTIINGKPIYKEIKHGEHLPENAEGERREFFFPQAKSIADLQKLAYEQLKLYYFDGFVGSFNTMGIPYAMHGDNARLLNPKLPEQNGLYKIKKVEYKGGVGGVDQKIYLDYRIDRQINGQSN